MGRQRRELSGTPGARASHDVTHANWIVRSELSHDEGVPVLLDKPDARNISFLGTTRSLSSDPDNDANVSDLKPNRTLSLHDNDTASYRGHIPLGRSRRSWIAWDRAFT